MTLVRIPMILVLLAAAALVLSMGAGAASTAVNSVHVTSAAVVTEASYLAQVGESLSHAAEKHGSDVEAIRSACTTGSNYRNWDVGKNRVVQTCFIDQRVGFRVLEKVSGKWEELTAYFRDQLEGQGWKGLLSHATRNGWKQIGQLK
jgi:hypothetical protein